MKNSLIVQSVDKREIGVIKVPDIIYTDSFTGGVSLKSADIFLGIKECESMLNQFIDFIRNSGGQIWLQDKNNKDLAIKLDRNFSLNYYYPECIKLRSDNE